MAAILAAAGVMAQAQAAEVYNVGSNMALLRLNTWTKTISRPALKWN